MTSPRFLALFLTPAILALAGCGTEKTVTEVDTSDSSHVRAIRNGSTPSPGQFPAIGRIAGYESNGAPFIATAVILDEDLALTAAHVVYGNHSLSFQRPGEAAVAVADAIVHPDYNPANHNADVAVIRLARKYTGVRTSLFTGLPSPGTSFTAVGFGKSGVGPNDGNNGVELYGTAILDRYATINTSPRYNYGLGITRRGPNGAVACPGDSGGPGLLANGTIWGIVSFGPATTCQMVQEVAYSTMYSYGNWVGGAMQKLRAGGTQPLVFYGAIAANFNTGGWGASWRYGSQSQANSAALSYSGGQIIVQVAGHQCGSYYRGRNGSGWSNGYSSRYQAAVSAFNACRYYSSLGGCQEVITICGDTGNVGP